MRLSYNWLKQFLPGLKMSPEELGEILSMKVAEVEEIINPGLGLEKVVVAEIIEVKPHPQADKLKIAVVDAGKGKKEIVCGAPNIKAGQKVPLALPGACLPNGMEIKSAVIRGVESNGMLCAEDELGLGPDHQGILVLDSKTKVGQPLSKALGMDDVILEIENKSLTHRPDLFNHFGFVREIGAILGLKYKLEDKKHVIDKSNKSPIQVKVLDTDLCPRYMATVMEGVEVGPSPLWLQNRLRNLGIKSINNVVDATNYVLMELGQPLHAFDADKLQGSKVVVRRAKKGEKLLALDKQEYELSNDDLVIADAEKPVALAGIIGGEKSGINEKTERIVIESASFDPAGVRRTSWRCGLRTEAVIRFEKGLPLIFPECGLHRAVELIRELANAKVDSRIYDLKSKKAEKILKQKREIVFNSERARKFIGEEIKEGTMKKILQGLGVEIKIKNRKWVVLPPAHRPDLNLFEDLIEEIVRIYGPEKIIPKPILGELSPVRQTPEFVSEKKIKNILIGCGFDEVYNYAFADEKKMKYFGDKENYQEIDNPLNAEQQYLRQSLVPGLAANAEKNSRYFPEFKIFEIGKVFCPEEKKKMAGLIFTQENEGKKEDKNVYRRTCEKKCFIVKNILELIFDRLGLEKEKITYPQNISAKAIIRYQGEEIGFLGEREENAAYFELDLDFLSKAEKKTEGYKKIINYPPIKRDLAFLIDKNIAWKQIHQVLDNLNELIVDIEPFDIFEDKEFGDKCNLGFHVTYQSPERTLRVGEVDGIQKKIIKEMKEKFNAQLRDF